MDIPRSNVAKCLVAPGYIASKGSLACVHAHVRVKIAHLNEGLRTGWACVGLKAGVGSDVVDIAHLLHELHAALATLVRTGCRMAFRMLVLVAAIRKPRAADFALVGLLARVTPHVTIQITFGDGQMITHRAYIPP
eukprot:CAMPEP_0167780458 /NCGR_PEP_ID=MMETSP0111_2-20121227/5370_1 /TAXON_ID=91324 /ORGANISM="Lotharella globosa, Strain CCCM811" /LENGTH=135 /DNA_ID=CAMNT_0007670975 /DNA_START=149 /DNA_END=556 /DNA_ORIENTATION=+